MERGKLKVWGSNKHSDAESNETEVKFHFNPTKLELKASAKWEQPSQGGNKKTTTPQYKGPDPRELTLDLMLDEYDGSDLVDKSRSVTKSVATLISWTRPTASSRNSKKPSAPLVILEWGSSQWFPCYVASVSASFTMFDDKGTPVRATVKVSLKEIPDDAPGQNPTSGSLAGHQGHEVIEGETLAQLAYQHYEKPAYWRAIANANGIDDPMRVRPGSRVYLPPIEEVKGLL